MKKLKASLQRATANELTILLKLYQNSSYQNPIKREYLMLLRAVPNSTISTLANTLTITTSEAKRIATWLTTDLEWLMSKRHFVAYGQEKQEGVKSNTATTA